MNNFLAPNFFFNKEGKTKVDGIFNVIGSLMSNPISFGFFSLTVIIVIGMLIKHNKIGQIKKIGWFELQGDEDSSSVSANEAISVLESIYKDFSENQFEIRMSSLDDKQNIKKTAVERASNVFNMALINFDSSEIDEKLKKYRSNGVRVEEIFKMYIHLNFSENLMSLFSKMDISTELKNSANEQMISILEKLANDAIYSIIADCRKFPIDNEIDFLTDFVSGLKESLKSSIIDISMSYIKASRDEQVAIQTLVEKRKKMISDKLSELSFKAAPKRNKKRGSKSNDDD